MTTPTTVTATTNGKWVKTTSDGFGRPLKVEKGNGSTTVSVVDYEYAPCACSPIGKLKRESRPYAPGGTVYWTEYEFDGLGRVTRVTGPGGVGVSTSAWTGNVQRVTDPAGRWKEYTKDGLGRLVKVTEPDPGVAQPGPLFSHSFAVPPIPGSFTTINPGGWGPWTVGGSGIDYIGGWWQSGDGDGASIDLNGPGPGTVSKSLSAIAGWTAGATYRVTFKYSANPGGVSFPPAVKKMRVTTANASYEFTADATGKTVTNMGWQTGTFDFVGAATDTLAFTSLDPAGNPCGIALDAVVERVSAPPPGASSR